MPADNLARLQAAVIAPLYPVLPRAQKYCCFRNYILEMPKLVGISFFSNKQGLKLSSLECHLYGFGNPFKMGNQG